MLGHLRKVVFEVRPQIKPKRDSSLSRVVCPLGSPGRPGRCGVWLFPTCGGSCGGGGPARKPRWGQWEGFKHLPPHTCALRGRGRGAVEVCLNPCPFSFPPFHQTLSCGRPAATGSAWMGSLRRPRHPREPGRRPTPTLGTAPSLLRQAQNRAARPVGPTSQTWPGR